MTAIPIYRMPHILQRSKSNVSNIQNVISQCDVLIQKGRGFIGFQVDQFTDEALFPLTENSLVMDDHMYRFNESINDMKN